MRSSVEYSYFLYDSLEWELATPCYFPTLGVLTISQEQLRTQSPTTKFKRNYGCLTPVILPKTYLTFLLSLTHITTGEMEWLIKLKNWEIIGHAPHFFLWRASCRYRSVTT